MFLFCVRFQWRTFFYFSRLRERSLVKRFGRNKIGAKGKAERTRQSANRSAASAKGGATLVPIDLENLLALISTSYYTKFNQNKKTNLYSPICPRETEQ